MPSITAAPTTFTSDPSAGTVAWSSPGLAAASDDLYAIASLGPLESTQRLKGLGADLAIPAGATILGVEVLVEATADTLSGAAFEFAEVSLVVGGSITGENRGGQALGGGEDGDGTLVFGGPTDLWGLALTPAQVAAADFGAVVRVAETTGAIEGLASVSVDHVQVRVHYAVRALVSRISIGVAIGVGL